MFKQINIQDLQPGMVIVRIIEQNGAVKIKKSGLVTSQDMVQGLIEMGIQQLEVDLDQTVEVEAPQIKKSATRRMLESNTVTSTRIGDGLSEQYHRSLFLPSAQGIQSAWQFYTKRYLLAAFIAFGGLGLGWTLASYQEILTLLSPQTNNPIAIFSEPVATIVVPVNENKQRDNKTEALVKADDPQDSNTDMNFNAPAQQVAATDDIEQSDESNEVGQTITSSPVSAPQISEKL
jgi:general secretion pathway protein B